MAEKKIEAAVTEERVPLSMIQFLGSKPLPGVDSAIALTETFHLSYCPELAAVRVERRGVEAVGRFAPRYFPMHHVGYMCLK